MKIELYEVFVPVVCQNGHKATARFSFDRNRLDFVYKGVPSELSCNCPKNDIGLGWRADGDPYIETAGGA